MAEVQVRLTATGRGVLANARRLSQLRDPQAFKHTAAAVKSLTEEARKTMLRAVQGRAVSWTGGQFIVKRRTGALAGAILGSLRYPYQGNALRGALEIKHPHYIWVRDGVKAFDMKPGLLAKATKRTKDGRRYRVVPLDIDTGGSFRKRIFRVVSDSSKGWIFPGTLPRRLDLYTTEKMRDKSRRRLREALKKDLQG